MIDRYSFHNNSDFPQPISFNPFIGIGTNPLSVMKIQKALVLFLLTASFSNSSSKLLTEKVAIFANSVFKEFITSVVWWHDKPDNVTDFIKLFQGCVVVVSIQGTDTSNLIVQKLNNDRFFMQTVFFAADVYEVEYFMKILHQDLVIPIRLIVVLTKPATDEELTELMEIAWYKDIADILVVNSDNESVTLTTYFPYRNGKCDDVTPVHLEHDTKDLFPKKFTNFHGCDIRTTVLHMSPYSRLKFENNTLVSISGIDSDVLRIVFEMLNASMKVVSAKDHGGLGMIVNGTPTGSLADLVRKEADIMLPGLFINKERYHFVQYSHPHAIGTIMWFGPQQREVSEWLRLLQPFMSHITPALFFTYAVFIIITMTVRRIRFHRSYAEQSIPVQALNIFLGNKAKFETKSLTINCLFVFWIWFCMVVRIAYQGVLVDGLQKKPLETPLGSFRSAVKLMDGYGGTENVRDFFISSRHLNKFQTVPLKNASECLKAVEDGKRFLIAADKRLAVDSAPNIQILNDDPITEVPICYCMRPGWPAVTHINDVLRQIIEKGFVEKVFKENLLEWSKAFKTKEDRDAKPLTLETLIGCFYGLGVMYGVCTVVLFIEIFYHRIQINKKRRFFKRK